MAIDLNKLVDWFNQRKGKLTYSMTGSRNGADSTADCSGSVTQALADAGATPYAYLYSTVSLGGYLQANAFSCIARNTAWDAQKGDVVLMSWGADMASSGGAGGHVGVMSSHDNFISTDYSTGGATGTAVSEHNWNSYYNTSQPSYIEVWRYNADKTSPSHPSTGTSNLENGEEEMYLIQTVDKGAERWYICNGVDIRYIKTPRVLNSYLFGNDGGVKLRVEKYYQAQLDEEFGKNATDPK
ncbi:MAG: hypothetical protein LBI13_11195 [Streptococcaceae bacterium]|jgi:hypothetical protein|nr:hypothetical protein [Streptococcaceae bacterium]